MPTRRNAEQSPTARILRQLTHPSLLFSRLRYLLSWGSEYYYSDLVDRLPAVGRWGQNRFPTRVELDRPLFLVGLRRSGTTIFYRIMHAHPDLFLYHERFPGDRINWPGFHSPARNWDNIWTITAPEEFRSTLQRYIGPVVRFRYRRWGAKLAMEIAGRNSGSPGAEELRHLLRCLPDARVIGIVRDPRDFVLSATKRAGRSAGFWIKDYTLMTGLFRELLESHAERFTLVRYEDLVTRPGEIVDRCCTFAGLDFAACTLDPSSWTVRGRPEYPRDRIVPHVEKWRDVEGPERLTVAQVDRACFPAASVLGYDRA